MRNWQRFSIRTLLLTITACCVLLAWIAAERSQTARETSAAQYLLERECTLTEHSNWNPRTGVWKLLLGDNTAAQYRDVHLDERKIENFDLRKLHDLPEISDVFGRENITDIGLQQLRGHPGIRMLMMWDAKITDAGLIHLRTIPRLTDLYLDNTLVTGPGLVHLEGLRLEYVSLSGTQLRADELRHLQRLPVLRELNIAETPVGDAGLVHLRSIKTLRRVNVTLCPVTEAGVDDLLAALPDLIVFDRFRPRGNRVIIY